ncbi:MAG: hypothetical protein ACQGVK_00805 [Myxococcota bacterium]
MARLAATVLVLALALSLGPAASSAAEEGSPASAPGPASDPRPLDLSDTSRLRIGIGDRLSYERNGRWHSLTQELDRLELPVDLAQIWLPRGWSRDWVKRDQLRQLADRGITPVVMHYYFGDDISKQSVEADRDGWYSSMWRMANLVRMDAPVLVILEPEWNVQAPDGRTSITDWPWFANDLRAAARMIKREAPNALVGTCPGDFPGTPGLEPVLGQVADELDFLAFQEMRASTDARATEDGYLDVAGSAVDYARYLKRAFDRPLLLAYVAVSSHGGWERQQERTLQDLFRRRRNLQKAGVFGLVYFQLHDDPKHRGYFGAAERHFGLLRSDGNPKPALAAFRAFLR